MVKNKLLQVFDRPTTLNHAQYIPKSLRKATVWEYYMERKYSKYYRGNSLKDFMKEK